MGFVEVVAKTMQSKRGGWCSWPCKPSCGTESHAQVVNSAEIVNNLKDLKSCLVEWWRDFDYPIPDRLALELWDLGGGLMGENS